MSQHRTTLKISAQTLLEQRRGGDCSVFLTGGTGFIGSHLAAELLRRGRSVILLARRRGNLSAGQRVSRLLDWLGVDRRDRGRLTVLEGHLDTPDLGLSGTEYSRLRPLTLEIVHCASDTSFSERKRREVEKANVANLGNVLALAGQTRCVFFHHVSTAYVAGKRSGICPEELVRPAEFTNVYEETKFRAEERVAAGCAVEGIGLNVYRPTITYGHSVTGRTLLFNGLYYPVRTVALLKDIFERDMRECGGKRAHEMGVMREKDGKLRLPLRVETSPSGGVNLIPIDHFVRAFIAIMEESLAGGIFHIANSSTATIEELAEFTQRFFRVKGISPVPASAFEATPRNGLEILFEQYIRVYGPYMKDTRKFEDANTRKILQARDVSCPEFDYDMFSRCMEFAQEAGWGTRLFNDV